MITKNNSSISAQCFSKSCHLSKNMSRKIMLCDKATSLRPTSSHSVSFIYDEMGLIFSRKSADFKEPSHGTICRMDGFDTDKAISFRGAAFKAILKMFKIVMSKRK